MADEIIVVPATTETGDEEIQWLINRLDANDRMHAQTHQHFTDTLAAVSRVEALVTERLLSLLETQQRAIVELQSQLTTLGTAAVVAATPLLTPPPPQIIEVVTTEAQTEAEPEGVVEATPENVEVPEPEKRIRKRRKL